VLGHAIHDIGNRWVWSRNLVSYQAYFVVGVMVAFHYESVLNSSSVGIARSWRPAPGWA
jgi:hypothetical protein